MDTTDYWPFAQEYSIWNAAVAALQFWMDNLEPLVLSKAIERVYTAFFCSDSAQHLWYVAEEILFGHFMTTLNDAFEWVLTLEDIGYESWNERLSVPTPLHREPWPFHVSTPENLSFRSATPRSCPSPSSLNTVNCYLTYEEDEESSLKPRIEDHLPEEDRLAHHLCSIAEEDKDDAEEHFPTVSLDDDVWMEEPVPERHLCIHENSQHDLCPYPCPYSLNLLQLTQKDALQYIDLNNIFKFPDVIVAASDEDVPSLEDILRL